MNKIDTKIEMKLTAQRREEEKLVNLTAQIEMCQKAAEKIVSSSRVRKEEIEYLEELRDEYLSLSEECDTLVEEMSRLMAEYEAIPWSPENRTYEEWYESVKFGEKLTRKLEIQDRLPELEKLANKTYYRR